jgi:hypothetical protein
MSTAKGIASRKERDQPPTGSVSTLVLSVAKSDPKMHLRHHYYYCLRRRNPKKKYYSS